VGLALIALGTMPILAWQKQVMAERLKSAALRADAACSRTYVYLAATLIVGLWLNRALDWWWADAVAALTLLAWLMPQAPEAFEGAHASHGHRANGDATGHD
jgi:divalent metal cation (Fe/Co/Zn/Cd) transporter